jgi:Ca2+-binding RTX toxin-like protein
VQGPAVLTALGFRHLDQGVSAEVRAREQYYVDRINDLVNQQYASNLEQTVRLALDSIMVERAEDGQLASLGELPRFFGFDGTTDPRIDQVFSIVIPTYEDRVDAWLPDIQKNSRERLALVSLAYNGLLEKSRKLRDAVASSDGRAEAWFEIRYNSNAGASQSVGIARRRYYESELFGLYRDPSAVTPAEAEQAYRMLQLHRNEILNYEGRWGLTPGGVRGWDLTLEENPKTGLEAANAPNGYPLNLLLNSQVESLEASFARAQPLIIAKVLQDYGQYIGESQLLAIRSIDIYLDPGRSNSKQAVDPNHAGVLDSIGDPFLADPEADDLMLGEGGADRLYGRGRDDILIGGPGNDLLDGGSGSDILLGGLGFDSYIVDGNDRIIDDDGLGVVQDKNGNLIAGAFEKKEDGNFHWVLNPTVTAAQNSPLTITLADGSTVVIEDFNDGDFGIYLQEVPQDVATTRTILGDFTPVDFDPVAPGIQTQADDLGNPILSGSPEPGRHDGVLDSAGPDLIQVGAGNDTVIASRGGADTIEAGPGRDTVRAGDGDDVVEAGPDADIVSGGAGDDRLYANGRIDMAAAIAAGNTDPATGLKGDWLAGGAGEDIVIGAADDDALFGGEGEDLLIGGSGDDFLNGDDDFLATSFDWTVTADPAPSFDAQKLKLAAGMQVVAEIHQGERSVLEYLLSPVEKIAQEAAREK